ncbi:MAG: glucosamine-6-phosphate deaminase [Terracidiphilus sp.]|jgi:glucosamine-6-phosphate deaminase
MSAVDEKVRSFRVENLSVEVHSSGKSLGAAAARAAAGAMKQLGASLESFGVIFATGVSQLDTLDALTRMEGIPWNRVRGFHLDEYVGLPIEHRASFRRYLRENLTEKVDMLAFDEVDGTTADLEQFCRLYAEKLAATNPKLALLGVGENGHLAFMDPAVADFKDPQDVKVVKLDSACRAQQVAEGWFDNLEQVPERAISVTIPAILRVPKLIISVPGIRKAAIMRRTLEETISTSCPASILRTHPDVTVYLDQESASELDGFGLPG